MLYCTLLFSLALLCFLHYNTIISRPSSTSVRNANSSKKQTTTILESARQAIEAFLNQAEHDSKPILEQQKNQSAPPATTSPIRTLVVVIGGIRGGEKAWSTLYKQVLDVNHNTDLALLVGRVTRPELLANATIFQRAKFHWEFPEFDNDWGVPIDVMDESLLRAAAGNKEEVQQKRNNETSLSWRQTVLPYLHPRSQLLGGIAEYKHRGSGAVIFVIRWFLQLIIQRLELTNYYDRFVITRADHYYLCRHDLDEVTAGDQVDSLFVPDHETWGGVSDRHLIVSSRNVMAALNVLPSLLTNPESYHDLFQNPRGNPERLLLHAWVHHGLPIKRFGRVMFTCGVAGDPTRWQPLGQKVPEGVQLKYETEYVQSYDTCNLTTNVDISTKWWNVPYKLLAMWYAHVHPSN